MNIMFFIILLSSIIIYQILYSIGIKKKIKFINDFF